MQKIVSSIYLAKCFFQMFVVIFMQKVIDIVA